MMQSSNGFGASASGRHPFRGLHAVVVDDNPATVKLIEYMMREAGWQVSGFSKPHEALAALPQLDPDLIVTDFRMPRMNGPEFLLEAERLHPGVPKMVMTAYGEDFVLQDMLRKASVPCASKANGLMEVLSLAEQLVSVRLACKRARVAV
ncbi:MAG: hypothetical protein AMXMBFR7_03390 [Planctomycetota bacterium]|nr:response regulator [Planctomycetota bacterium]